MDSRFSPVVLWPAHFAGNKRGSVTYSTDRENKVKIFIISLRLIRRVGKEDISRPYSEIRPAKSN